ncbi:MAG: MgtC/SapB family protein [Dehalococcoidia bacterium]
MSAQEQFEVFLWILYAMGLGALVGLEREFRGHEAGFRTTALVCGGAAVFGEIGQVFDESRVAASVVQGIGFLGAGLLWQRGGSVRGVTTAATIWVMAAVGLVVGLELWLLPLLISLTLILVLELAPVSDRILTFSREHGQAHGTSKPSEEREPPRNEISDS